MPFRERLDFPLGYALVGDMTSAFIGTKAVEGHSPKVGGALTAGHSRRLTTGGQAEPVLLNDSKAVPVCTICKACHDNEPTEGRP